MSEPKRTWLTADEFEAEYEQRRAAAMARRQAPQPASPANPPVIYELKSDWQYRPNKLDSSGYPGQVVYRRSPIERRGPEAERGGAAP
ncbi:MAG: hypothetical protein ACLQQ0_15955, partial [Limisphaerales bacterium]